jgi:hypothetical protein
MTIKSKMHEQCWYVTSNLQKFRPRFLRHCGPMYKVGCNSDNKIFLRTNNSTNINKTNYHLSPSDWIQKMRDHDIWHWKSRSLFVNFNKGHRGRDRMVVEFTTTYQSVLITTDVVSSNFDQGEVYNIVW